MTIRSNALVATAIASLLVGVAPSGASAAEKQSLDAPRPESAAIFFTFGGGQPVISISNHGNIVRFNNPAGFEHLGAGAFSEGYVLCTAGSNAFDTGDSESGFGPSVVSSCSGTTCTVTRRTTVGPLLQLQQIFKKNASGERSINITMNVKNLTGAPVAGVVLRRQADFDIDNTTNNRFSSTERDSVFAWNAPADSTSEGHSLVLTNRKKPAGVFPLAKVTSNILDSSCNPAHAADGAPVQGDFGATIQYNLGTLNPGGTASVVVRYERD